MRGGGEFLDLNNFPKDYDTEAFDGSSSAANYRFKKKSSGRKDDTYKVYECRFCSLRFCKSQALGGHMNRHRQEREIETLHRARELVFSNEGLPGTGIHMSLRDGYGMAALGGNNNINDPYNMQFQPVYPILSPRPPAALPPHHICSSHYVQMTINPSAAVLHGSSQQ